MVLDGTLIEDIADNARNNVKLDKTKNPLKWFWSSNIDIKGDHKLTGLAEPD
jgi:hypothetical protein